MTESIIESLLCALIATIISFFNGGVRYPFQDSNIAPVWIQLVRNFAVFFILFLCAISLTRRFTKKK